MRVAPSHMPLGIAMFCDVLESRGVHVFHHPDLGVSSLHFIDELHSHEPYVDELQKLGFVRRRRVTRYHAGYRPDVFEWFDERRRALQAAGAPTAAAIASFRA